MLTLPIKPKLGFNCSGGIWPFCQNSIWEIPRFPSCFIIHPQFICNTWSLGSGVTIPHDQMLDELWQSRRGIARLLPWEAPIWATSIVLPSLRSSEWTANTLQGTEQLWLKLENSLATLRDLSTYSVSKLGEGNKYDSFPIHQNANHYSLQVTGREGAHLLS